MTFSTEEQGDTVLFLGDYLSPGYSTSRLGNYNFPILPEEIDVHGTCQREGGLPAVASHLSAPEIQWSTFTACEIFASFKNLQPFVEEFVLLLAVMSNRTGFLTSRPVHLERSQERIESRLSLPSA